MPRTARFRSRSARPTIVLLTSLAICTPSGSAAENDRPSQRLENAPAGSTPPNLADATTATGFSRTASSAFGESPCLVDTKAEAEVEIASSSEHPVPPPFTVLSAEQPGDRVIVSAWGRRYEFEAGPLPSSILSQGQQLLAAPARLKFGGAKIDWSPVEVIEAAPGRICLATKGRSDTALVEAAILIEYDGMLQLDLAIRGPAKISALSYEISLRNEQSTLFSHHMVYDYETGITNRNAVLKTAGRTLRGSRRFRFVPSFALGGREVGVEWWSESNADWHGPRVRDPYELARTEEMTTLRVEPISAPLEIRKGTVWRDRAAIFALPLRPPPTNWRSVRFVASGPSAPSFASKIGTRLAWVAFGSSFQPRWHGLPAAHKDLPEHKQLRRRLQDRGIAYIPYGKLVATPTLHPEPRERFSEWSADGVWWTGPLPSDVASVLEFNGISWSPRQPHTYAPCMGVRSYRDWILSQNLEALDTEHPDGLYFDHATIARMCRLSPRLKGKQDREIWEYFAVRDFFKRLYAEMKARNPDALLVVHSPGHPRALAGAADFIWTGEQLSAVFRRGATVEKTSSDPSAYRPEYLDLPSGYMDAALGPHPGGAWVLIPQISRSFLGQPDPEQGRRYHRGMHGWALANDVPLILGNTMKEEAEKIYRALDRFGSFSGTTIYPWWSKEHGMPGEQDGIVSTVYMAEDRGMIVLLNPRSDAIVTKVDLDTLPAALRGSNRVLDLESPASDIPVSEGFFSVRVPARDFRIIAVE